MCSCDRDRICGTHSCPDCGGRVTFSFLHACRQAASGESL